MTASGQVRGALDLVRHANRPAFLSAVDPYRLRQVEVVHFDSVGQADAGVEAGYTWSYLGWSGWCIVKHLHREYGEAQRGYER